MKEKEFIYAARIIKDVLPPLIDFVVVALGAMVAEGLEPRPHSRAWGQRPARAPPRRAYPPH